MFSLFVLIAASLGPGLLWLWYFYRQDRYEPEPLRLILKIFIAGLVLVVPAGIIEAFWREPMVRSIVRSDWTSFFVLAFFVVALVEEGLKTGFLWWLVKNNHEFDERADGIIYGITLGLGFASLENFLWASVYGLGVAAVRAVVTTLAHASFTGWVGYYLARARFRNHPAGTGLLPGFLLAWATHGAYDFLLFLRNPVASILAFSIIGIMLFRLYRVLQEHVATSPFR